MATTAARPRRRARRDARLAIRLRNDAAPSCNGAPDRIRTCDLRLRRPTLYPLSYRRADPNDTAERRHTFGFWFDALPGATTRLRVVETALGERKTRADSSGHRSIGDDREAVHRYPCMFNSRRNGRPVSRQRSKWIDSTICRTSDLTVSDGASSDAHGDHQANAIDVEDPGLVVAGFEGDRAARKTVEVTCRPACTPGTPLDIHRACCIGSPRCRSSAAPRDSSRDRRNWARASVRSCLGSHPRGARRRRSQGWCSPRPRDLRRSSREGPSSRHASGRDAPSSNPSPIGSSSIR